MASSSKYKFRAVSGYFQHDSVAPSRDSRISTSTGLGLIDQPFDTDADFDPKKDKTLWERFVYFLNDLNKKEAGRAEYKLFFLARHGEGYHNVQEAKVGTAAWDSHWSKLEGDGTVTWADADLTETGKAQARALNAFWHEALKDVKVPAPQKYYVSPHSRTLETCKLSFDGLELPADRPFQPVVKEMLRERYGEHTCDRRRSRTWIAENYPQFDIEDGLTENDELWTPDAIEAPEHIAGRLTTMLDDVFRHEGDATFVSFTMHSWAIFALHMAVGHPGVWVTPGSMVPLLVKAELAAERSV
ncbi:histidine phosphatase superfamily [Microdochium trichocladiopsis]|uniref:Histidine phosphatase superfamily n=1 Tax=Microdochium trichocladiopsis TaxID=1682393 RepID=A0A9P9BMG5_9PEZI|nr:histidine phosphatase superfamily [Microdochium trichocladiopsis]KAH7025826.1 histidine phosphatase superfamily [Microdochium trichocladiopsis]